MSTRTDIIYVKKPSNQSVQSAESGYSSLERKNVGVKVRSAHNQSFDRSELSETVFDEHYSDDPPLDVKAARTETTAETFTCDHDATAKMFTGDHDANEKLIQSNGEKAEPVVEIEVEGILPKSSPEDDDGWTEDEEEIDKDQSQGLLPRIILSIRKFFLTCLTFILKKTKGYLVTILLLLGYLAYFIAAMCHRFDDEGSHRLLGCTILGVVIATRSYVRYCFNVFLEKVTGSSSLTPVWKKRENTARFFLRWIMYGACTGVMVWVIVDKAIKEPNNLRSLPGIVIIMFICLCFSTAPNKVNYHTIFWSVGLQFLLSLFILNWKTGKDAIWWLQSRIDEFFDNSEDGSKLMFGQNYKEHYMIFGAMPLLFFTNGMMTLLYYCGVMQFIVTVFGNFLNFILDTSPVESMAVAAGTFMEGITALTAFRPYLKSLTKSQLFLVITSCFSSIGSAFLAILAQMGVSIDLIIGAMLISAPATFTICKLMFPETSKKKHIKISDIGNEEKSKYANVLDAFQEGSVAMLAVVGNIVVSAFAFVCLISWVNNTLAWFGDRVGISKLSIEMISSYILYPVPLAMGVAPEDCRRVAMLYGYRLGSSNIIAFFKLAEVRNNRLKYVDYMLKTGGNGTVTYVNDDIILDQWGETLPFGFISERSEAIITYALCGFSSMLSVAIHLGMMGAFLPKRRKWLSEIAIAALVAGNLANCMTGCFACLFF